MNKYYNVFKAKRIENNLSLDDLSSKTNIKKYKLMLIENFSCFPNYKNIDLLQEVLNINEQEIKEYYDLYSKINEKENKSLRRGMSLIAISFMLSFVYKRYSRGLYCYHQSLKIFYKENPCLIYFFALVAGLSTFSIVYLVFSKGFIKNWKYYICLIISLILYGIILYIICKYYPGFEI